MNSEKKTILKQWLRILIGLVIFAFGVHLTIFANIGLAPWDCLSMGVSYHTPLNYGMSVTVISLVIIGIDLLMRERIGFGTLFDALVVGNTIQFFNDHNPFPLNEGILTGIPIMLLGFFFMAIGQWRYMSGAQCCGPRDMLLVGPSASCRSACSPSWFSSAGCSAAPSASGRWSACSAWGL